MQEIIDMAVLCELNGVKLIEDSEIYFVEWSDGGYKHRQIYYCYEEAEANFVRRVEEVDFR